jgi:hypothetical protein
MGSLCSSNAQGATSVLLWSPGWAKADQGARRMHKPSAVLPDQRPRLWIKGVPLIAQGGGALYGPPWNPPLNGQQI